MKRKLIIATSVVAVGLLGSSMFFLAHRKHAQSPISMDIVGTSQLSVTPDQLTIDLTVEADNAKDNSTASQSVATTLQKVIDVLKSDGVNKAEIQSGSISVSSGVNEPDYCGGGIDCQVSRTIPAPVSTATADLTVQLNNLDLAGKTLADVLAVKGASVNLNDAQFDVRDKQAINAKAEGEAVANARAQAESIASASGLHIKRIANIDLTQKPDLQPLMGAQSALGDATNTKNNAPIPVQPGKQDVTAQATVTFEMS